MSRRSHKYTDTTTDLNRKCYLPAFFKTAAPGGISVNPSPHAFLQTEVKIGNAFVNLWGMAEHIAIRLVVLPVAFVRLIAGGATIRANASVAFPCQRICGVHSARTCHWEWVE